MRCAQCDINEAGAAEFLGVAVCAKCADALEVIEDVMRRLAPAAARSRRVAVDACSTLPHRSGETGDEADSQDDKHRRTRCPYMGARGMGMSHFHKRHRDFEVFDEIQLKVVPRYKTSELSGDEWRTSVRVTLSFKGAVVTTKCFGDMDSAIRMFGATTVTDQIPDIVRKLEETKCDQPGCSEDAVSRYRLKQQFSRNGHRLDPSDQYGTCYRQFCSRHLRRGDGGREDSDDNYEVLDSSGPDKSTNMEISPSAFGGQLR